MALSKVLFLTVVLCLIYLTPARPPWYTCNIDCDFDCGSEYDGPRIEETERENKVVKRACAEDEIEKRACAEDEFEDLLKRCKRDNEFFALEDKVKALKRSA